MISTTVRNNQGKGYHVLRLGSGGSTAAASMSPRPAPGENRVTSSLCSRSAALNAGTARAAIHCVSGLAAFIGAMVAGYAMGRRVEGMVADFKAYSLLGGGG